MRSQEIIQNTFADFRQYLKSVAGIDPNRFSTDHWMGLLLNYHFSQYIAMISAFREAQAKKQAEQQAAEAEANGHAGEGTIETETASEPEKDENPASKEVS